MGLCVVTIFGVLAIAVVYALASDGHLKTSERTVWTGQDVKLECGDHHSETARRFWRKGYDVLAVANIVISADDRFETFNQSTVLKIRNVTAEDEGEYTCVVNAKPKYKHIHALHVKELVCESPEAPLYGGFENESISMDEENVYKFGDKVKYFCFKGYQLVGPTARTCSDPYKGWSDALPSCEPEFIARLKQRLDNIEYKVDHSTNNNDNKQVALLENKVTTIETRVSALEGNNQNYLNRSTQTLNSYDVDATLHRFRTAINNNIHRTKWEKVLQGEVGFLGEKDGYLVSEFTWVVESFDEKIVQHRAKKFNYLESKPFYTNTPGYRLKVHLYPDYEDSGYVGIYVVLVQGEFDNLVAWPFTSRYDITIISRDENDYAFDTVIPSQVPGCNFQRPPPDNTVGCGFSQYAHIETLFAKKDLYLYEGAIVMKITVYLNYN